ncbi:MAG: hypothetical protein O7B30_04970 [Thaumarchaeota archaeon]|nr:hypothetical protein [Nitrososphaerota archaeon]
MFEGLIKHYRAILVIGFVIFLLSFLVGVARTANQATLSQLEFAGDLSSSAYISALTVENVLLRYLEIVPLFGLGVLKLGIGFAIATIVVSLRATGESAARSLRKAGQNDLDIAQPFFSRFFPKMLLLGILTEAVAVIVMVGWIFTGLRLVDLRVAGDTASDVFRQVALLNSTFEAFAEPIEGVGVALLIGGIAFGLMAIVGNLGMQASEIPRRLVTLGGKEVSALSQQRIAVPRKLLGTTILGILITASALPIAVFRVFNEFRLDALSGEQSSLIFRGALVTERIIAFTWETWMFVGIALMLFSIGFLLLSVVSRLRAQRSNLDEAVNQISGSEIEPIEAHLAITKIVPLFLVSGLLWMILFFGLFTILRDISGVNVIFEQFAGRTDSILFQQSTISQATYGQLIRPGKVIGLGLIFTGIGLSLLTIVINLKLTAMTLPGAFARIVKGIKGEAVEDAVGKSPINPMSLVTRGLFYGMILGFAIILIGTFPLALLRIANTQTFLTELLAGRTDSIAFQVSKQTQLMLEHFIGPFVGLGNAIIFFFIGRFFGVIVGFVQARRQIISEGVESAVIYANEKKGSTSTNRKS